MSENRPLLAGDEPPFAYIGGETNFEFPFGKLVSEVGAGSPSVRICLVGELDSKILACVPFSAWNRKTNKRAIAPGLLTKPMSVQVLACGQLDREQPSGEETLKVWLGFLDTAAAQLIEESGMDEDLDHEFEDGFLPYAQALVEVANEHFSFFSASEHPLGGANASGSQSLDARVGILETSIAQVLSKLDQMASGKTVPSVPRPKSTPQVKQPINVDPDPLLDGQPLTADMFPNLDPGVVQAAFQAGIEPNALQDMQRLMTQNVKAASRLKQQNVTVLKDPLSEDEDQQLEEGAGPPAGGSDVQSAIGQLAQIVSLLTEDKKKKKSGSKLDLALDSTSASSSDGSSLGTGKRAAAARRVLRATLLEAPQEIYTVVERLIYEDLNSVTVGPGLTPPAFSARAWMEHRSRINNYRAVAHCGWAMAGALDAARDGNVALCRARLCLGLMQVDQSCIDKGSWTMAAEMNLESSPPFSSLARHVLPNVNEGESPFSRLLDARWAEVMLSHLRETDDYIQKRRNVGRTRIQEEEEDDSSPSPKRRPKPKPKAKSSASAES